MTPVGMSDQGVALHRRGDSKYMGLDIIKKKQNDKENNKILLTNSHEIGSRNQIK